MNRDQAELSLAWLEATALRADIELVPLRPMPETATELVYWQYYLHQLEDTARHLNRPDLGILLGQYTRIEDLGEATYIIGSGADTVQHFLTMYASHTQYRYPISVYAWHRLPGFGRLIFHPAVGLDYCRTEIELALAAITEFLRHQLGELWNPLRTGFQHQRSGDLRPYTELWGDSVAFDAESNFIDIIAADLNAPLRGSDPLMSSILRDYADKLTGKLASRGDIKMQVKLLLSENLKLGGMGQNQVAKILGLSRSTLKRRLEAVGSSYMELKNEVVESIAKRALTETRLPIAAIASQVGYNDAAAFVRAFSTITGGITPGRFRQQNQPHA